MPLNVLIVDDIKPYKERKVAILNGAHTALVPVAFQAGLDTVGEAMNDPEICAFVEKAIYARLFRCSICRAMSWSLCQRGDRAFS
jgi:tagaturonate reductase